MQLVIGAVLLASPRWDAELMWYWQLAWFGLTAVLAALLLLRLPGDLLWRPRRSKRTSREVVLERQRIARDLHDHVGSRIVGVMAQLDCSDTSLRPVAQALEQCLLELRLVVDSMDGDDDALPSRLARLRHRLQPALLQRGVALTWQVSGVADFPWPSGQAAREFSAIAQEAISNALQHAQATMLTVSLQPLPQQDQCPGAWCLQVCDNGRGLELAAGMGKGLVNMRRRAELQGGHWALFRAPSGGLCVQVVMPAAAKALADVQCQESPQARTREIF